MEFTTNLEAAVNDKDVLVLAVPSPFTRSTSAKMAPFIQDGQKIVNVAKGIEEATLMTLSEIIEQEIPNANVAVLSGPSHAEEVGKGIPTTIVVGSKDKETAEILIQLGFKQIPDSAAGYYTFLNDKIFNFESSSIDEDKLQYTNRICI